VRAFRFSNSCRKREITEIRKGFDAETTATFARAATLVGVPNVPMFFCGSFEEFKGCDGKGELGGEEKADGNAAAAYAYAAAAAAGLHGESRDYSEPCING
jgi:hypothetical protein